MESKLEITRLSSKGQLVIPQEVRNEVQAKSGSMFTVTAVPKRGLIVLKKVESKIDEEDLEVAREVERAWKEIESGRSRVYESEEFFSRLKSGKL